jgi:hypothetical protein
MRALAMFLVCCLASLAVAADKKPAGAPEPKTDAQKYAAVLNNFLLDVNQRINDKLNAEQSYYQTVTDIYVVHYGDDVLGNLALDRIEGAALLASRLATSPAPELPVILQESMRTQALADMTAIRKMLGKERDIRNSYMSAVEQLSADRSKIMTLSAALKTLSVPNGTDADFKELAAYAQEVNSDYEKARCADIDSEISDLTVRQKATGKAASSAVMSAKAKDLDARIKDLQQYKKDNCSDANKSGSGDKPKQP